MMTLITHTKRTERLVSQFTYVLGTSHHTDVVLWLLYTSPRTPVYRAELGWRLADAMDRMLRLVVRIPASHHAIATTGPFDSTIISRQEAVERGGPLFGQQYATHVVFPCLMVSVRTDQERPKPMQILSLSMVHALT
jgi:hypothetical protein